ncbi:MAG TPA: hypothetical protein VMM82_02175 [Spirochaetia bacterium]|nr:hypothetical protein [Spirochaetia bacterium]
MKALRMLLVTVSLTLGVAAVAVADFDIGGSIDDYSSFPVTVAPGSTILGADQRDKVGVWVSAHPSADVSIAGAASYDFTLQVPLLVNLDYLNVNWRMLPWLNATLGRFTFTDFTTLVLNHTLDGLMLEQDFSMGKVTEAVGFSGLLLKPVSLILMSSTDSADQSNSSVYLAAPRLIEKLEVLFTVPLNINLSLIAQQDLRPSSQLIQAGEQFQTVSGLSGGSLTTEYLGLGVSGGIVSSLYFDAFAYGSLGSTLSYLPDSVSVTGSSYQYAPIYALMGGLGLKYYLEETLSSRLEFQAVYSSGNADATSYLEGNTSSYSTMFVPISQQVIGVAFMPQLGNLVMLDLNYSLKPWGRSETVWKNLQLMARVLSYLRPTTGPISQPGLSATSSALYLGTEPELIASFRPYSDFGLVLSTGVFIPNGDAFTGPQASPTIGARIEFSVSF